MTRLDSTHLGELSPLNHLSPKYHASSTRMIFGGEGSQNSNQYRNHA